MQQNETDPRRRFFNEEGDSLPPFRLEGWRGAGLDRGRFDNTRIPRFLFEAIVESARTETLLLRLYTPDRTESVELVPEWAAFSSYVHAKENWCLEYVLYDKSGRWAVLADPDVIVVGADLALADSVDRLLGEHGTSFKHVTECDFPGLDPANPNHSYLLAVLHP